MSILDTYRLNEILKKYSSSPQDVTIDQEAPLSTDINDYQPIPTIPSNETVRPTVPQPSTEPVMQPTDRKKLLEDYLTNILSKKYTIDKNIEDLQRERQMQESQGQAFQGAATILQGLAGAPRNVAGIEMQNLPAQQKLQAYLLQKQQEKQLGTDKEAAIKDLYNMDVEARRAAVADAAAKRAELAQAFRESQQEDAAKRAEERMAFEKDKFEKYQSNTERMLNQAEERIAQGNKKLENTQKNFSEKQVNEISKRYEKANIDSYDTQKERVIDLLDKFGVDHVAGRVRSLQPIWASDTARQKLMTAIEGLVAPLRQKYFGSALTETEKKSYDILTGKFPGADAETFAMALNDIINAGDKLKHSVIGGYSEENRAEFFRRKQAVADEEGNKINNIESSTKPTAQPAKPVGQFKKNPDGTYSIQ